MLHFHAMYEKDLNYACHIQEVANTALAGKKKKDQLTVKQSN